MLKETARRSHRIRHCCKSVAFTEFIFKETTAVFTPAGDKNSQRDCLNCLVVAVRIMLWLPIMSPDNQTPNYTTHCHTMGPVMFIPREPPQHDPVWCLCSVRFGSSVRQSDHVKFKAPVLLESVSALTECLLLLGTNCCMRSFGEYSH